MTWLIRNLFNAIINANGVNTGGVYPTLAAGVAVTSGKSYAYGSWAQVVAAATVTAASWITAAVMDAFYFATGEQYQVGVGLGAGGSEVLMSGSQFHNGHVEATAVGELNDLQFYYAPYPLYVASGSRIAAESAAASANARVIGLSLMYRTGVGT